MARAANRTLFRLHRLDRNTLRCQQVLVGHTAIFDLYLDEFNSFQFLSISGLSPTPIIEQLEKMNLPVDMLSVLKHKTLGTFAAAVIFYKLATPARYATTVFLSMVSIRRLMPKGMIHPKPTPKIVRLAFRLFGIKLK